MLPPFLYDKLKKNKKEKFVQEYLYIEEPLLKEMPKKDKDKEEKIERGVVVIELM